MSPRYRETPEVAAAGRRMIRAVARRAATDVDSLELLRELREECDRQLGEAARAAHAYGWSWTDIGDRLGITRQAARQAYADKPRLSASAVAQQVPGQMPLVPICDRCGTHMDVPDREQGGGRTKRYCSTACRVAAHRDRSLETGTSTG